MEKTPYEIPCILINTSGQRIEEFVYRCAGAGITAADTIAAREKAKARVRELGFRVADWIFSMGAVRVWGAEPCAVLNTVAIDQAMHQDKLVDGYAERNFQRAMALQIKHQVGSPL